MGRGKDTQAISSLIRPRYMRPRAAGGRQVGLEAGDAGPDAPPRLFRVGGGDRGDLGEVDYSPECATT